VFRKGTLFDTRFQELLLKFLMLAVTHNELLLGDHCISRHFKFKTQLFVYLPALPTLIFVKYNFPSIMFWTFFKFKGQNRKNIAKLTARVSPYMKIMFQSLLVFITAINLRNVAETKLFV
jgi:hypothetical protein